MHRIGRPQLLSLVSIAFGLALIALATNLTGQSGSSLPNHREPYKNTHELVALARLRGEKTSVVLIAAVTGKSKAVADEMTKLGGEVHYRADDVDYLRGRLPVEQVLKLAMSPDVESLDMDVDSNLLDPTEDFGEDPDLPSSVPPDPDTPLSHPYLPEKDMDIVDFQAGHPTYDGRGAVMAILDATPDMLLPELQRATSLNGEPIRKISELLASTDPRDDIDPMWVKMDKEIRATGGKFSVDGTSYTAPADGEFRFGVFNERDLKTPAYLHKDVNFDGNPDGSSGLFAVLVDEKSGTVWVDTNQDHSFADERALEEYARRGDIGIFGTNRPASARRKTVGFAVQINSELHYVRLTLGVWQHVTEVSGAVLGKGFYGGSYDGIAGDAQFASYFTGDGSLYRRVESVIAAARNPKVDVICLEPAVVDVVSNPLHDGHLVAGVIFDRVTAKYKKPLLSPANNTFGMTTVLDEVSSHGILAVGAYQNGEAYKINNGAEVAEKDNLHLVGSFGPSGNGSLKPDIISPSELISTEPGYKPAAKVKGVYELPVGYYIGGGTSTAGPSASAAVTLLVSAARQAHVAYDAERIRTALISSARFISTLQAYQQGNGLVQVNGAWKILQELDKRWDPLTITSSALVKTEFARYLDPPFKGPGIFEREGWLPDQSETRTILFTRTTGSAQPIVYNVEWVGNHGAFEAASTIALPLNKPVELPIKIQTHEAGVYSAILNLKRPGYAGIAYQVLNTVVAAYGLNEANDFTVNLKLQAVRPGSVSNFFRVPVGAPALRLHLAIPNGKATLRLMAFPPDLSTKLTYDLVGMTEKGFVDRVIPNPTPGVWEIQLWDNNFVFDATQIDSKPLSAIPSDLTVSVVGVSAAQAHPASSGSSGAHTEQLQAEFTNGFAPMIAAAQRFPLGSEFKARKKIAAGEQQTYSLDIPTGAERLSVQIGEASDVGADLDLYLFRETQDTTILEAHSDSGTANESIDLIRPEAGKWKIVVDAFRVPSGTTEFSYRDVYFHPAFGSVEAKDDYQLRSRGAKWQVSADLDVKATPVGERVLAGWVAVMPGAKEGEPVPALPSSFFDKAPPPPAIVGAAPIAYEIRQ